MNARIRAASFFQCSVLRAGKMPASARRIARSSAIQHMALEWVKCRDATPPPAPAVGLAPGATHEIGEISELLAGIPIDAEAAVRIAERRVEEIAERVELQLSGRAIANANRL